MNEEHLLWNFDQERLLEYEGIIGIDEAGRGALAGPMVLAGVYLNREFYDSKALFELTRGIRDSKKLTPKKRDEFFNHLNVWKCDGLIDFVIERGEVEEIEEWNIVGATRRSMDRAIGRFDSVLGTGKLKKVDAIEMPLFSLKKEGKGVRVLMDGLRMKGSTYAHEGVVKGDDKSLAIAMGSILAKVTRDRIMQEMGKSYPNYLFESHKGYGSEKHRKAIVNLGVLEVHRPSFLGKILG